jgi:integrase
LAAIGRVASQPEGTLSRKNELRRIRWEQIDLDSRLIRLSAAQTKGKKPRSLPIYGDMRRWLEQQREPARRDRYGCSTVRTTALSTIT